LQTDTEVEADIYKFEFVTPLFSRVEIEPISESASQSELEDGNSSDENGLVMIFKDFLKSDRRLKGDLF